MAKSKAQIVNDINNKFVTNGNIRAVDANTTLKDILDCTELNDKGDLAGIESRLTNVESTNTVQNNRLTNVEVTNSIQDGRLDNLEANMNNGARTFGLVFQFASSPTKGFVSFRGIRESFVNITFRIRFSDNSDGSIVITHDIIPEIKAILDGIIDFENNYMLNFLVTVTNLEQGTTQFDTNFRIANLNIHFLGDNSLILRFKNYQLQQEGMMFGDEIYTSIAVHSRYTDPSGKIMEGIKTDSSLLLDNFLFGLKGTTTNPKDSLVPPKDSITDPKLNVLGKVAANTKSEVLVAATSAKTVQPVASANPKVTTVKKTKVAPKAKPKTNTKKETPPKKSKPNRKK